MPIAVDVTPGAWPFAVIAAVLLAYASLVCALAMVGRRLSSRALVTLVPNVLVLLRRLLGDRRVPRRRKLALLAATVYLALPVDLVPDFIPVAGHLDDLVVAALVLRYLVRSGGPALIAELWPGPRESLRLVLRLA